MLTLYQAEWCPHSRKIRQKLTELGVEFLAKQVEAEPKDRREMRAQVGTVEIPVLVTGEGAAVEGEEEILAWLDRRFDPRDDAEQHREKMLDKSGIPS
jgi:glutathione S-transferase